MSQDLRISPKERLVLTAVMETYIATGEPVASQAIARLFKDKEGLSAATIRNVMSSLGEAGLLDQPHTSAGRIPTGKAFRFYVEQLAGQAHSATSTLTRAQQDQIEDSFAGVNSSQQFLERTSHVLALISSGVGLALASASDVHLLEHIHFSRLSASRVLAVVVTRAGLVLDRVLGLEHDLTHTELETAARYLNENFHGWSIERIRYEVKQRIEIERGEYDHLMRSLQELWSKSLIASEMGVQTIFIEGVANLLATELDRDRLRQMLNALEAKQRLIELLNAYVDSRQQSVRVVVGLEETMPEMSNLVLIGAPTRLGADSLGTVAVLAPTRIQYQETISAVSFIAQLSERILQVPQ
jgi:heat-inducible transcriptional repressor